MYDYEEFCPISKTASILGERWTIQIIREMHFGVTRFNDFRKFMPSLSPTLLNKRLKSLEENDILYRRKINQQKGFEYILTPGGKAMLPIIQEMGKWGVGFVFDSLSDNELNAERLVRDISFTIDGSELPSGDTVIRFKFTDLDQNPHWFIKTHNGKSEVCDGVPEGEIDVYVTSTLMAFTEIWMGSQNLQTAIDREDVIVVGDQIYTQNFARWLGLNIYAAHNPKFEMLDQAS
ncbi:MAG: transcriptional regulator [Rhodospirillaceae bacterium]|nr:transcriptional regulator [Rhodospirillaceae bacterium]MBT4589701.1 transcriptional regulator [Rhodospirillaceae bacterium]MBT5939068.1 transcriptional regulator [Rhodospirillaceae bacterium]MBT7268067.1 transcriptional regulator [Rhodospirillaceae bacterium]